MADADWIGGPAPATEDWHLENADRSGGASLTGSEQIVSSGTSRWRASLTFQLWPDEALWMRALLAKLAGRAGTVLVGPFDRFGIPRGGVDDQWALDLGLIDPGQSLPFKGLPSALLYQDAPLRAAELRLRMAGGRRPVPGNYIGVNGRLHLLTGTTVVSSSDTLCQIEPVLRAPVASNTGVIFDPVCPMRLAGAPPAMPKSAATFVTDLTLDLVEAF